MNKTNKLFKVLIVDDEKEYRDVLEMIIEGQGYIMETASSGEDALKKLNKKHFNLVLTDLIMGGMDGVELLKKIKEKYEDVEVIIITGFGTIENAVEAMKKGASTYFIKSHDPEELLREIKKVEQRVNHGEEKLMDVSCNSDFMLMTKNTRFRKILDIAKKAAKSDVNILILGESGVGKEVLARYIYNCSDRKNNPFMPINCSSFSDSLLESELFGHEKGAFTGAIDQRKGRFEAAEGGTLFLDEVGDVSLNTQVKLLRVIEEKNIQRIGSNDSIKVNFRLITATNKELSKEIFMRKFREDFFYRISTITIEIPPLRDRKEDLNMLIEFFLKKSQTKFNKKIVNVQKGVMAFLRSYDYPGNIRELKNILERLVVLSEDGKIVESDLPECKEPYINHDIEEIKPLKDMRKEVESDYIEKVLEMCEGNISEAARKLCISRRQLFNKISEYGLRE